MYNKISFDYSLNICFLHCFPISMVNHFLSTTLKNCPILLPWGSPAKQSGRNEGIFSSFGVKKFRKFLKFLYCFASHKQHITIGKEFLLLF